MMALVDTIAEAKESLDAVDAMLGGVQLPAKLNEHLRSLTELSGGLLHARPLVETRTAAMEVLDALPEGVDASGMVDLWGTRITFKYARLFQTQAYLSTTWSLIDIIAGVAGQLLCTDAVANSNKQAKFWEHFLRDGQSVPRSLGRTLSHSYGLPVAVSYALRNHFLHDGAQLDGWTFFEDTGPNFRVSDDGWSFLEQKLVRQYKISLTGNLASEQWPWPKADIRKVFVICEREIDAALGLTLTYAVTSFKTQVGLLVEGR